MVSLRGSGVVRGGWGRIARSGERVPCNRYKGAGKRTGCGHRIARDSELGTGSLKSAPPGDGIGEALGEIGKDRLLRWAGSPISRKPPDEDS